MKQDLETPMERALHLARKAFQKDEVPVGAVLVDKQGKVVCEAHNLTKTLKDPTAHAEMLILKQMFETFQDTHLYEYSLYVTLEPCTMCAGALAHARLGKLYYAATDEKGGAVESGVQFFNAETCHHRPEIYTGLCEQEASQILKQFFVQKRCF